MLSGLNHLVGRSSAISFLGTIIVIHDTDLVTVKPVYRAEVAYRVMTLIDGQQRLSTSVMMNIALHHHGSIMLQRIGGSTGEAFDWMREQAQRSLADLMKTFAQSIGYPTVNRYYPRISPAFDDVCSNNLAVLCDSSPAPLLACARHR